MHLEVNVNWDDGEPEELALYFFQETGGRAVLTEICGCGRNTGDIPA